MKKSDRILNDVEAKRAGLLGIINATNKQIQSIVSGNPNTEVKRAKLQGEVSGLEIAMISLNAIIESYRGNE